MAPLSGKTCTLRTFRAFIRVMRSIYIILRLRERKKLLSQLPDFGLKAVGENASAEIPVTMRTPLLMSDLQTLLMYLMVGDRMPWATTRWCKVGCECWPVMSC